MIEEEGTDFVKAVVGKFATSERTIERLALERKAGATAGQRSRRGPPKKQVNFRATAETRGLLDKLVGELGIAQTDVIERAIAAYAESVLKKGGKR